MKQEAPQGNDTPSPLCAHSQAGVSPDARILVQKVLSVKCFIHSLDTAKFPVATETLLISPLVGNWAGTERPLAVWLYVESKTMTPANVQVEVF